MLAFAQKQNKTDHFPGSPLQKPSITPILPEGTLHASKMANLTKGTLFCACKMANLEKGVVLHASKMATLAKGVILHVSKTTEQGISWPDITTEQVWGRIAYALHGSKYALIRRH